MKIWKKIDKHPALWFAGVLVLIATSEWVVEGLASLVLSLL
jgi:hypothetical protein